MGTFELRHLDSGSDDWMLGDDAADRRHRRNPGNIMIYIGRDIARRRKNWGAGFWGGIEFGPIFLQ